jgi:hypothetical protein
MNFKEKSLYHQIHPVKLATDISTSIISILFFWDRQIFPGLLIGTIPSVIASALIIRYANLENYRNSSIGQYMKRYMTRSMQVLRFLGQIIVWIGAWYQSLLIVALGFLFIIFAWIQGKILPVHETQPR